MHFYGKVMDTTKMQGKDLKYYLLGCDESMTIFSMGGIDAKHVDHTRIHLECGDGQGIDKCENEGVLVDLQLCSKNLNLEVMVNCFYSHYGSMSLLGYSVCNVIVP